MIVPFDQFLREDQLRSYVQGISVVCLQGDAYPSLFCRKLVDHLTRVNNGAMISCDMSAENYSSTMASLQTTFLGSQSWYWLRSDETLSKKQSDAWHAYLDAYQGPHTLFFYTNKPIRKIKKTWCLVKIPSVIDRNLFSTISSMMEIKQTMFGDYLYQQHPTIAIDTAVLLAQYSKLLGKNWKMFIDQWLHELLVPETSLFSLSQAFFARQPKQFFYQWQAISAAYAPQFWIVYWSEQLWQAYAYVRLQKAGRAMDAKKVSYRLSFSFKNRDYRSYSLTTLRNAHQYLYEIDFHLKNGGNDTSLELFYTKFLQKEF